ncbi:WD repeat domain-containing protein 83 [Taenia crassiceps]|uniref:WD repeat domain-containing protein 83 n=1 Tax=Taenia crassiceps TaxID=6207 RepID=A0ABR4QQ98_9CEST
MSGFSLGTPTTQVATKPSETTFSSFGNLQSSGNSAPTFAFGSPVTTSASTSTASFSFGNSLAATFTTLATSTASHPVFGVSSFGSKPATPSTSSFGLGTSSTTTTTTPTFGTPAIATSSFEFQAPTISTSVGPTVPSFGFDLTSKPSAMATAPFAGLSFGSPSATNTSTSGFAFGLKSTPVTSAVASTVASSSFTLTVTQPTSGGLTFGAPATPTTSTAAVAAPTSGLSFGHFGLAKSGTTTTTTSTTTSGFSLSSLIKSSESTTPITSTTTAVTTSSTAAVTAVATITSATTTTTTTGGGGAALPSTVTSLTYRQLEDMVNKWTYELDEQSRNFSSELNRLNRVDGILIANAEKITDLHAKVEVCKAGQSRIEQELEFVESQQRTLEDLLEPLEQAAADLPPSQQHADAEREAIFQMCISTDLELGQLLGELREMAARVNAVTADLESTTAPAVRSVDGVTGTTVGIGGDGDGLAGVTDKTTNVIGQVTRILNSHMHSLTWLSQNTQELMEKMKFLNTVQRAKLNGSSSTVSRHFCIFYKANTESGSTVVQGALSQIALRPVRRVYCRQNAVRAVRFNADGQYCLTAGGNRSIRLWNPVMGRLLKTYIGHGGEVSDVQASSDNSSLGSGGADNLVVLWDVASGQALRRWRKHAGRVNAVRFAGPSPVEGESASSSSLLLLSVGVDGMLLVWDVRARTQYPIQTMHEAKDSVNCLAVRRWQIITGSVDRCVRVYDIRKGIMIEDYIGHPVTSVGLSFDGQCLLVASQDSVVRLFDHANGELLSRYTGHVNKDFRIDCCFLNEDAQIASGSEEGCCVVLWNVLEGGAASSRLDHSTKASLPAWFSSIGETTEEAKAATPIPLIHSLSAHPTKNALLTAGGDFFWLWNDATDERVV